MRHDSINNRIGTDRHYLMPWSRQTRHFQPVIARGDGCGIIDVDGKRYLDLSSGWNCTNLGHGNQTIIAAMREQIDRLLYAPPYLTVDIRAEFARALCERAPWAEGARAHFTTGGGDANDDAVRTARRLTGRSKILAAYRSFHGDTSGTSALTGGSRRWAAEPNTFRGVVRFFAPMPYRIPFFTENAGEETVRALDHFKRIIEQENPESIAAVIIEPVLGSDGLVVYPEGYLKGVRELANRIGALVIHDEIMCGFGRVGEMFATQRLDLHPDIITFAKGVTGAYVPLGGFLIREGLAARYDERIFDAGHTYSGHPLAMAAGLGALRAYDEGNHFKSAYRIERWLKEGLSELQREFEIIGDIRGIGPSSVWSS
ncbi:aminotransferase class III-fold pyridoxal phosphate-dependent enzyme [Bradyrhizobium sp. LA6.7]|uniref:aminotransferase class III-fold pyridoxal phosphate-dependent enzyme n=1 Tax=unclassified Bradyrhizobium TaxID=2631580 RepID=UPI003393A88B